MSKRLFGMVSTTASRKYTPEAITSFFKETPLADSEKLVVIDNDNSLSDLLPCSERIDLRRNEQPRSFAENFNSLLKEAPDSELYFLNNDLIFTNNWIKALEPIKDAICSPVSNREFQYTKDGLRCERFLGLEDYLGNESALPEIVSYHRTKMSGYRSVFYLPFFCIKIPPKVSATLGPLDESFGKGGAEDNDYCLRAHLEGIKILFALESYVLHFSGKSTWHGAESEEETKARDAKYLRRFQEKWGEALLKLSISGDLSVLMQDQALLAAFQQGNFKLITEVFKAM